MKMRLLLIAVAACTAEGERSAQLAARVDSLADAYSDANLELNPELCTGFGITGAHHSRICDNSRAGVRAAEARMDTFRIAADAIDPSSLAGTPQEVTFAVLRDALAGRGGPVHLVARSGAVYDRPVGVHAIA